MAFYFRANLSCCPQSPSSFRHEFVAYRRKCQLQFDAACIIVSFACSDYFGKQRFLRAVGVCLKLLGCLYDCCNSQCRFEALVACSDLMGLPLAHGRESQRTELCLGRLCTKHWHPKDKRWLHEPLNAWQMYARTFLYFFSKGKTL